MQYEMKSRGFESSKIYILIQLSWQSENGRDLTQSNDKRKGKIFDAAV